MAFELKEHEGSLFFNDRKSKPAHPDYTGKVVIEGKEWRLAGWKRQLKSGTGFLSLRISPPRANQGEIDFEKPTPAAAPAESPESITAEAPPPNHVGNTRDPELDDDIPF